VVGLETPSSKFCIRFICLGFTPHPQKTDKQKNTHTKTNIDLLKIFNFIPPNKLTSIIYYIFKIEKFDIFFQKIFIKFTKFLWKIN
jgi:hypothetical protein